VGWSLVGALLAAVCFGAASVLEAQGSRAAPASAGLDPRLLSRLLRSWPFLIGVGLDLLGFVLELAALLTLPLFLVQSAVASSLAVTAVLAARVLGERLRAPEWTAVVGVCLGLALLGFSAGREGGNDPGGAFDLALMVALVLLGGVALWATRLAGSARAASLGLAAGLAFGVVALSARTLTDLRPAILVREPSVYLLAVGGLLGLTLYATAVQRGSVAVATSALVLGETVAPAFIGTLLLGDRARPGLAWMAIGGFVIAVAAALALARFGDVSQAREERSAPA
jgi:drug/metabolite transporter (DMT)-like permease